METPERIFPTESIDGDRHVARHNQYEFDVYKLIHLSREIPETSIALEDYVGQLDGACWTDGDEHRITPRSVLEIYRQEGLEQALVNRPELANHVRKIDQANYSHPIIQAKIITTIPEGAVIKINEEEQK